MDIDAGANLVMRREEIFARFLIAELRLVGQDRGELAFELLADIDDKRRTNVVIKRGINNLERTMWRNGDVNSCAFAGPDPWPLNSNFANPDRKQASYPSTEAV